MLAAAQRVVHQVAVGANPYTGGVPFQIIGDFVLVDNRAINDVAGDAGQVVNIGLAYDGLDADGTDQREACWS